MTKHAGDNITACSSPRNVACGALCVIITGIALTCWSIYLLAKEGIPEVSKMVDADLREGDQTNHFSSQVLLVMLIVGQLCVVIVGVLGMCAKELREPILLSLYFYGAFIFGLLFIALFFSTLQFESNILAVVDRQAQEFCNATFHPIFEQVLGCSSASRRLAPKPYVVSATEDRALQATAVCGEECQHRVALVREMGGCDMLHMLCHRWVYVLVGYGYCRLDGGSLPSMVRSLDGQQAAQESCARACNSVVTCSGYVYSRLSGNCSLVSPVTPANKAGLTWTAVEPLPISSSLEQVITGSSDTVNTGVFCHKKTQPIIVGHARHAAKATAVFSLMASVILIWASMCGCFLQYTLMTKRTGKKAAGALCGKLLCPCSRKERSKNGFILQKDIEEDESEDGAVSG